MFSRFQPRPAALAASIPRSAVRARRLFSLTVNRGGQNQNAWLAKRLVCVVLVTGLELLVTSCATTNGNWSPDFPEKGSAKGGASLLRKR
jgi:hypothetical protein